MNDMALYHAIGKELAEAARRPCACWACRMPADKKIVEAPPAPEGSDEG